MKSFTDALTDAIKTRFPGSTCVFNGHRDCYDMVINGKNHRLGGFEVNRLMIFIAEEITDAYEKAAHPEPPRAPEPLPLWARMMGVEAAPPPPLPPTEAQTRVERIMIEIRAGRDPGFTETP